MGRKGTSGRFRMSAATWVGWESTPFYVVLQRRFCQVSTENRFRGRREFLPEYSKLDPDELSLDRAFKPRWERHEIRQ